MTGLVNGPFFVRNCLSGAIAWDGPTLSNAQGVAKRLSRYGHAEVWQQVVDEQARTARWELATTYHDGKIQPKVRAAVAR